MAVELPRDLVVKLFQRRALLWICQRAELKPDTELHTDSTSLVDAVSRYRSEADEGDLGLASVFWEACWTESIVDLFHDATSRVVTDASTDESASQRRFPYRFTTDPDSEGQIDRRHFLPIYEVNGTSLPSDPEGQHGGSPARRLAYKMGLMRRLESFPGRAVVVVGAYDARDLETVKIAIDFMPSDNTVVILWPSDVPVPDEIDLPNRLSVHFLRGTRKELVDALAAIGAPKPTVAPRLGIRYGRSALELTEEDLVGVDQEFVLIRENDLHASMPARDSSTRDYLLDTS